MAETHQEKITIKVHDHKRAILVPGFVANDSEIHDCFGIFKVLVVAEIVKQLKGRTFRIVDIHIPSKEDIQEKFVREAEGNMTTHFESQVYIEFDEIED